MPNARLAQVSDLTHCSICFRVSEVSSPAEPIERAEQIWREMLSDHGVAVFVSADNTQIVPDCMLITAPNLLRAGRRHGFLGNCCHPSRLSGGGNGRAVVGAALAEAWTRDCHHVLMQSGRQDPRVHRFYQRCGFEPGLRVGYVAHRPAGAAG